MQSISKSLSISSNCILFFPTFQIFYLVFEIEKISNKELTIHLHLSHQILFYESFLMCRLFVINVLRTSSPYFLSIEKRWQTSKVKILFEVEKSRIRSCLTLVKGYSSFLNGTSWVLEQSPVDTFLRFIALSRPPHFLSWKVDCSLLKGHRLIVSALHWWPVALSTLPAALVISMRNTQWGGSLHPV